MNERSIRAALTGYTFLIYAFLLIPPLYLVYLSFFPQPSPIILVPDTFTLTWFHSLFDHSTLLGGLRTSVMSSFFTALVSMSLAVLLAKSYLKLGDTNKQRLLILIVLPILVPSIVMGLALTGYFRLIGLSTGMPTLVIASVLWALPFASLIALTSMTNLNPDLRLASYDLGASGLYTFWKVELPIISPGVLGAFLFSFLLSFNEFERGFFVSGQENTLPIYMYSTIGAGGIPNEMFAASTIVIGTTVILLALYGGFVIRQSGT